MQSNKQLISYIVFSISILFGIGLLYFSYQFNSVGIGTLPEIFQAHPDDCNGADGDPSYCNHPHGSPPPKPQPNPAAYCTGMTASSTTVQPGQQINFTVNGRIDNSSTTFARVEYRTNIDSGGFTDYVVAATNGAINYTFPYTVPATAQSSVVIQSSLFHSTLGYTTSTACKVSLTVIQPETYACQDLQPEAPTVVRGDSQQFTCIATGNAGATANFQVLYDADDSGAIDGTETNNPVAEQSGINLTNNQAQWTVPVPNDILAGEYLVQCQICDASNNCTSWGQAN